MTFVLIVLKIRLDLRSSRGRTKIPGTREKPDGFHQILRIAWLDVGLSSCWTSSGPWVMLSFIRQELQLQCIVAPHAGNRMPNSSHPAQSRNERPETGHAHPSANRPRRSAPACSGPVSAKYETDSGFCSRFAGGSPQKRPPDYVLDPIALGTFESYFDSQQKVGMTLFDTQTAPVVQGLRL
jgi:hypothetical protein